MLTICLWKLNAIWQTRLMNRYQDIPARWKLRTYVHLWWIIAKLCHDVQYLPFYHVMFSCHSVANAPHTLIICDLRKAPKAFDDLLSIWCFHCLLHQHVNEVIIHSRQMRKRTHKQLLGREMIIYHDTIIELLMNFDCHFNCQWKWPELGSGYGDSPRQ